jgi:carbamoyltransferase
MVKYSQINTRFPKQTSIYYGPQYTTNQLESTLKNYTEMFNVYDIKPENVAKLISENNIVTIFQGRSEAGPRALGNRSILYNPTDPNGKDYVNKVKNREWFRPFAGSVLKEKAHEWFDMAGLEESPFMMYAMDVWPDKQEKIKAITHVDGTCRIQTVTEEQNPHYYKLIQEFEKITGVPILFNTSFNLAGDPLVETIEDALETMLKSDMKYMYVPELGYLLEKK